MSMEQNYGQYAAFRSRQLELSGMLSESSEIISKLNMTQYQQKLSNLSQKVHNDAFKIQVVGTFKNGKSTFINSLLGERVLPAYSIPCTAVINEVKWGEEKRAVLHFCNPLPKQLPKEISPAALEHMKKHDMKDVPPLEIPYGELENYVVIPMGADPSEMLLESPYEKVELFWPLPLLKNGVEIIDSPGLNENSVRTKVTTDYLLKADAILFVLNATAICGQAEMDFIENDLNEQGFKDPFFIVNRFDMIAENERGMLRRYAESKLKEYTTNEIYYVSALDALEGKMASDSARIEASGMKPFEEQLEDFLVRQKGKAKLAQPARELSHILTGEALKKTIPMQREMLGKSLDEIKRKRDAIQPRLNDLQARRSQLSSRMDSGIYGCQLRVERLARQFMASLPDRITTWVHDYKITTKLGLIPSKSKISAAVKELADHVNEQIRAAQRDWQNDVLTPLLEEQAESIFVGSEHTLTALFDDIDLLQTEMSGSDVAPSEVPVWQRVGAATVGIVVGDAAQALNGYNNGFNKNFAKGLALRLTGVCALAILEILNPATLVLLVIGSLIFNTAHTESYIIQQIKEKVRDQLIDQLNQNMNASVTTLSESCVKNLKDIADQIVGAVDATIQDTTDQIDGVIREMKKGEANKDAQEAVIHECEQQLLTLDARLGQFVLNLLEDVG